MHGLDTHFGDIIWYFGHRFVGFAPRIDQVEQVAETAQGRLDELHFTVQSNERRRRNHTSRANVGLIIAVVVDFGFFYRGVT